jgi:hypothetical protein
VKLELSCRVIVVLWEYSLSNCCKLETFIPFEDKATLQVN